MKNNIPQGYKATPLGIIPQEWEVKSLHYLGQIYSGGTPDTEVEEYWNGNIAWCTPSDITKLTTKSIECTDVKINDRGLKESSATLLPPQSIVVCTRATIGNAAICKTDIATNQGFKNIIPNKETNSEWLYYVIIYSKPRLVRLGCGSTFLEVSKKDFSRFKISVPPLAEQKKIAEVLGLWDKAIEKQSQLIEQLTLRKRGLMQQLLTAKRRLPGFSGPWVRKKVKDIFKITRGNVLSAAVTTPSKVGENLYPVFSSQTQNKGIMGYFSQYLFEDCITWTTDGANAGDVNFRKGKFYCTNVCGVLKSDAGYANECIASILNKIAKFHVSYIGNPKLMNNVMAGIPIVIPQTIEEQTAIAQVLTAADREIELAQQKLELLRQQKRGLMQQLLTGKKRVK